MHFALPPRKSSHPPPYSRSSRWTGSYSRTKGRQVKYGVIVFCLGLTAFYLFLRLVSTSSHNESTRIPPGTPEVVLVTLIDTHLSKEYISKIKENREDYALRHGMSGANCQLSQYLAHPLDMQATKRSTRIQQTMMSAPHPSRGPSFLLYDMH